jgi:5-methylcytosine-specific restriction endonuclease McrA
MRWLTPPTVDDGTALDELRRSKSANAKAVAPRLDDIRARYDAYIAAQGDPWQLARDHSFQPLQEELEELYTRPPKALSHIGVLRKNIGGACPVCGRDSLGTLDHYLPKSNYAEYAFFSRNLIPACDRCNNARGNLVQGANLHERPLHPYFDTFAAARVMTVDARPDWRAPQLTPVPFAVHGTQRTVVQWHIDNVIQPAGIDAYLTHLWGRLVAKPTAFLGSVATRDAVAESLLRFMRVEAVSGSSPNAWRSCFYHGLAHNVDALDFLVTLVP